MCSFSCARSFFMYTECHTHVYHEFTFAAPTHRALCDYNPQRSLHPTCMHVQQTEFHRGTPDNFIVVPTVEARSNWEGVRGFSQIYFFALTAAIYYPALKPINTWNLNSPSFRHLPPAPAKIWTKTRRAQYRCAYTTTTRKNPCLLLILVSVEWHPSFS